jgi:tRNA modification GTPase
MDADTIAAISTPFGEGAIALLRLSGAGAIRVADTVFRGRTPVAAQSANTVQHGEIYDGDVRLDDVLLTLYRAPASFTGEDTVEISCHGGILVTRRILELLIRQGARSAEPGEFTRRAFLNGKLDLTQAEAVMDLISAQTDLALRAANEQLAGRLGERERRLRQALLEVLAHVEAYIDFPDEDIDPETGGSLRARIAAARSDAEALLETAERGRILREGLRTVIYGEPNVGKSSLLNRLLGFERAIVSAQPGTTRDVIEEVINLRGIPLRLVDTAGIRESEDELELEGSARTRRAVSGADMVLHVLEAHRPREEQLMSEGEECRAAETILVLNKTDLGEHSSWSGFEAVRISCTRERGLDDLATAIEQRVFRGTAAHRDWTVAINARHHACLTRGRDYLSAALRGFDENLSPEFIAEELRAALEAVGDVVGKADAEELLGVIFGRFCIGK